MPASGQGTHADPYCEISSALNNLGLHRYVFVSPGSYSTAGAVGTSFRLRAEDGAVIHTPDPLRTGFSVSGGTSVVEIAGLRVTGPGGDKPGIFVSELATLTLRRVRVDDAGYYAIACQSAKLTMDAVLVTGSDRGGVDLNNCTFGITNSVIANNGGEFGGVRITSAGAASYFVNNTVVSNTAGGSTAGGVHCASAASIVNSIITGNGPTDVSPNCSLTFSMTGQSLMGQGNLMQDPTFVDAGARDYHLQTGSYGIDQGSAASAPPNDFDGRTRPYGSAPDMGAFEWRP